MAINRIRTSQEQSQKLIKLGIDVNTADMYWLNRHIDLTETKYESFVVDKSNEHIDFFNSYAVAVEKSEIIPAWSLSALLELMPKSICIKQSEYSGYFYFLEWQFANDNSLRYVGNDRKCLIDIYSDHDDNWKDSIDTAFEMVVWLLENGKI